MHEPPFYQTEQFDLKIAGQTIHLVQITNFDDLLEALLAKGSDHEDYRDERVPYWADLWHSSIGLAQYLLESKAIIPGQRVLEIGCGLGLPGIVAGMMKSDATLSDYLPEALDFARINWELNNQAPFQPLLLDWRNIPPQIAPFDVVLAADVAYERRSFDALTAAFLQLLRPGGRLILAEPSRDMANSFVLNLMHNPHFSGMLHTMKVNWNGFDKTVKILDLTLQEGAQ